MEDAIRKFKDKYEHIVINFHQTCTNYYQDILNQLKVINESIEEKKVRNDFNIILIETEKAIRLEHKIRCQIISEQFIKIKEIIKDIFREVINDLQNKLQHSNISEFNIIYKTEYDLILAGSFDFAYYHDVEIIFKDVDFILCPGCYFSIDNFRLATNYEISQLNKCIHGWEEEGFVTCLDDRYYIVAQQIKFKFHNVKYEVKDGFICEQRISDWAKKEIEL